MGYATIMFSQQTKETHVPPSLYTLIKENLTNYREKSYMHSA